MDRPMEFYPNFALGPVDCGIPPVFLEVKRANPFPLHLVCLPT